LRSLDFYSDDEMPLLTFIVVKKRHHTRLFKLSEENFVSNVEPGTIVDSNITTSSSRMNFFLNSHEAQKGTNQIGNYVVLVNEIDFTLEEIEELTYALCHTDQRSTKTEAIPSLVHLADRAASNTRKLFPNSTRYSYTFIR
jgi:eukaryotic translation initiation factor 2C